jgi:uncharacterized glyoxalase superfamily protein PhnB
MSDQGPTRPAWVPKPYSSISPWVISRETARFIDFASAAYGATELGRMQDPDGRISHAELLIGESVVLAFDGRPHWPETPAFLRLYVEDADATFERALAAGAVEVTRVTPLFWGDRVGRVRDPQGHLWWLQQRVEEVDDTEMQRRLEDPVWQERMAYVTSADLVRG